VASRFLWRSGFDSLSFGDSECCAPPMLGILDAFTQPFIESVAHVLRPPQNTFHIPRSTFLISDKHLIQMPSIPKNSFRHWETCQGCLHSYGHPLSRRCAKNGHITQNSNEMDCQKKETTEDARREFASKTWENSRIESSLSEGRSSVIRPSQLYPERTLTLPLYKKPFKPGKTPNYRF
jgi:hypothetical protein